MDVARLSFKETSEWSPAMKKIFLTLYKVYGPDFCRISSGLGGIFGQTCRSTALYYKQNKRTIKKAIQQYIDEAIQIDCTPSCKRLFSSCSTQLFISLYLL